MTRVNMVVAVSRNGVIGRDGGLPWHIPSDLKTFKAITMGHPIIMGRRTWDGLPRKPLPGRRNIVITRRSDFHPAGAEVAGSPSDALALCAGAAEVSVIGGGEIYRQFMDRADRIYLTEVDLEVAGDTYFPEPPSAEWQEVSRETHPKGDRDTAGFVLRILDRVKTSGASR